MDKYTNLFPMQTDLVHIQVETKIKCKKYHKNMCLYSNIKFVLWNVIHYFSYHYKFLSLAFWEAHNNVIILIFV